MPSIRAAVRLSRGVSSGYVSRSANRPLPSVREELISGSQRVRTYHHQRIVRWLEGVDLASPTSPAALLPVIAEQSVISSPASSVSFIVQRPPGRCGFRSFSSSPASSFVPPPVPSTKSSPSFFSLPPQQPVFVAPSPVAPASPAPASPTASSASGTPTLDRILGQLNDLVRPQEMIDSDHGTIFSTEPEEELTLYTNTEQSGVTWDSQNASHVTDLGPQPSPCIWFHFDPSAPSPHTPVRQKRRRTGNPVQVALPAPVKAALTFDDTDEFLHAASFITDPFVDTIDSIEFAECRQHTQSDPIVDAVASLRSASFETRPFNETVNSSELAAIKSDVALLLQSDPVPATASASTASFVTRPFNETVSSSEFAAMRNDIAVFLQSEPVVDAVASASTASYVTRPFNETVNSSDFNAMRNDIAVYLQAEPTVDAASSISTASFVTRPFNETVGSTEFAAIRNDIALLLRADPSVDAAVKVDPLVDAATSAEHDSLADLAFLLDPITPMDETTHFADIAFIEDDTVIDNHSDLDSDHWADIAFLEEDTVIEDSESDLSVSVHWADVAFIMDSDSESSISSDDSCACDTDVSDSSVDHSFVTRVSSHFAANQHSFTEEANQNTHTRSVQPPMTPAPVQLAASTLSTTAWVTIGVTVAATALFALSRWA